MACAGVVVSLVLLAPWVVGTALAGKGAVQIFGLPLTGATAPDWGEVLRFAVGPVARSPLAWCVVLAAALPLAVGRGIRLVWAARLWVLALGSWGLALATTHGDLGRFAPSESVVLAPAALTVAVCVGLGISAFENDLSGREFGWRQLLSVAALVFVGVGLLPVVAGAVNGRWGLPSQGAEQPLAFLGRPSTAGVSRVLWLGDPRALPVGGWTVRPGLAYASLPRTSPTRARSSPRPVRARPAWSATRSELAVSGGTVHLGRLLASAGVRYVVVVDGLSASGQPTGPPSVSAPPPAGLEQDLLEQDDLQVVPGVLGVQVFANGEFVPVTAGRGTPLPATTTWSYPSAADVAGWQPLFASLTAGAPATATVATGTLYAGYAPAGNFSVTAAGRTAVRRPAFGWAAQYQVTPGRPASSSRSSRSSRSASCSRCWPGRPPGRAPRTPSTACRDPRSTGGA